jgi:hypothetical protein
MTRAKLAAAVAEVLPEALAEHLPAAVRPTRMEPDWQRGLLIASIALGACLAAAGTLAWISRQTGVSMDKIAFNYPYDDEESWFV